MHKNAAKYSMMVLWLLIYFNRYLFIAPYEYESHNNKEINSVIEWVIQTVIGEGNDIDEDGDLQTDCNSVKEVGNNFYQEFSQNLDLLCLYSKNMEKTAFSNSENIPLNNFYTQIDHPPQVI